MLCEVLIIAFDGREEPGPVLAVPELINLPLAHVDSVLSGLCVEHVREQPRVDTRREPQKVLEMGVPAKGRLAAFAHVRVGSSAGGVGRGGQADAATN
jgi:hypothetical protein